MRESKGLTQEGCPETGSAHHNPGGSEDGVADTRLSRIGGRKIGRDVVMAYKGGSLRALKQCLPRQCAEHDRFC
jgi:hypothetical protein